MLQLLYLERGPVKDQIRGEDLPMRIHWVKVWRQHAKIYQQGHSAFNWLGQCCVQATQAQVKDFWHFIGRCESDLHHVCYEFFVNAKLGKIRCSLTRSVPDKQMFTLLGRVCNTNRKVLKIDDLPQVHVVWRRRGRICRGARQLTFIWFMLLGTCSLHF